MFEIGKKGFLVVFEGDNNNDNSIGNQVVNHQGKYGSRNSLTSKSPLNSYLFEFSGLEGSYFYCEFSVIEIDGSASFAIGLAPQTISTNIYPGWTSDSVGLHGDDGKVYSDMSSKIFCAPFGKRGDTIGMGLRQKDGALFYTHNGECLGITKTNVSTELFVCIALDGPAKIEIKKDLSSFLYKLSNLNEDLSRSIDEYGHVENLTIDNFQSFIDTDTNIPHLVEFYGPHCVESMGRMFRNRIKVGKVDMSSNEKLTQQYIDPNAISSGRVIKCFKDGKMVNTTLPTEVSQLSLFCKQMFGPPTSNLWTREDFVQSIQESDLIVLGYFGEGEEEKNFENEIASFIESSLNFSNEIVQKSSMFSVSYQRKINFVVIKPSHIAQSLGIETAPAIIFVKDHGKESSVFDKTYTKENITNWVNKNSRIWVSAIDKITIKRIPEEMNRLTCLIFVNSSQNLENLLKDIRSFASEPEFSTAFNFFICENSNDAAKDLRKRFSLEERDCAIGVVRNAKTKYLSNLYQNDKLPTSTDIQNFCKKVTENSQPIFLKSAPVTNSNQTSPAFVFVTSQFHSLIKSPNYDSIVLVYTAFQGNSSVVRNIFVDSAIKCAHLKDHVRFFELDIESNDPPEELDVETVPSIYFCKMENDKFIVRKFEERRTLSNLLRFVSTNTKIGSQLQSVIDQLEQEEKN